MSPTVSSHETQAPSLERRIGHSFSHRELLERALTHSSQAREAEAATAERVADNEQLEFLGDAVLGLVTTEELFRRFPQFSEGQLSKLRAHFVSKNHLILVAEQLELGRYLRLGRGEEKSGGRNKAALLVDALEALVGAVYLDAGLETARLLILRTIVQPQLEEFVSQGMAGRVTDFKSALQERLQAEGRTQPAYVLVKETGPEHRKTFTIEVRLLAAKENRPEFTARAHALTKKAAEQDAARQVLEYLASQALVEQAGQA
ncbi:MAG: ribonuclease III [Acidobacteria bacterium]|nr:ribonuclease III [Acidobacteriota bacterium]MBV9623467.1 ribonuclease III [Acidobacteriota bacterium]